MNYNYLSFYYAFGHSKVSGTYLKMEDQVETYFQSLKELEEIYVYTVPGCLLGVGQLYLHLGLFKFQPSTSTFKPVLSEITGQQLFIYD